MLPFWREPLVDRQNYQLKELDSVSSALSSLSCACRELSRKEERVDAASFALLHARVSSIRGTDF
jgi:hypothetical protein